MNIQEADRVGVSGEEDSFLRKSTTNKSGAETVGSTRQWGTQVRCEGLMICRALINGLVAVITERHTT